MAVRLNVTMEEELYRRLKKEIPPRGISAFIAEAVRARLQPSRKALDAGYRAASREKWRRQVTDDWAPTETEGWPR